MNEIDSGSLAKCNSSAGMYATKNLLLEAHSHVSVLNIDDVVIIISDHGLCQQYRLCFTLSTISVGWALIDDDEIRI